MPCHDNALPAAALLSLLLCVLTCRYPDFQAKFFPHVLNRPGGGQFDAYCKYDDPLLHLFVSSLFLAGIVGAFIGSFISRSYGRRPAMLAAGACFLAGAVLMAPAVHVAMLIIGRVVMGLGQYWPSVTPGGLAAALVLCYPAC